MKLIGIDEVGRGCWAGPLVAAAVMLPDSYILPKNATWKLRDSKLLQKQARSAADIEIRKIALAIGIGWVSAKELDVVGLTHAVRLAMQRAVHDSGSDEDFEYDEIIVDGNYNFLADNPKTRAVVRADGLIPAVSAASIVAKVARDAWMSEYACKLFPAYGFGSHVGYGTKRHIEALEAKGPCNLHRFSYKPIQKYAMLASCK